ADLPLNAPLVAPCGKTQLRQVAPGGDRRRLDQQTDRRACDDAQGASFIYRLVKVEILRSAMEFRRGEALIALAAAEHLVEVLDTRAERVAINSSGTPVLVDGKVHGRAVSVVIVLDDCLDHGFVRPQLVAGSARPGVAGERLQGTSLRIGDVLRVSVAGNAD